MPFKFPLGVDVENEATPRRQVAANLAKDFFPVGEAPYVIDRVENAADHVEVTVDLEVDNVLAV